MANQDVKTTEKKDALEAKPVLEKEPAKKQAKQVSEVKAAARFIRISPRKVRVVIEQVKGLPALEALHALRFVNKRSALPVSKLIASAVANAENNFQLDKNSLFIKTITANDGPILKRFMPRAHGRSTEIRKRMSHIEVVLGTTEIKQSEKEKATVKPKAKQPLKKTEKTAKPKANKAKPVAEKQS